MKAKLFILTLGTGLTFLAVNSACKPREPSGSSAVKADGDAATPAGAAGGFAKYCTGADVDGGVTPNYEDDDTAKAARILSVVKPTSYKLYADMMAMHGGKAPTGVQKVPNLTKDAHNFLVYLCGEFRDNPAMIAAKIAWIHTFKFVQTGGGVGGQPKSCAQVSDPDWDQSKGSPKVVPFNTKDSPWSQICIEDYEPYILLSKQIFDFREAAIRKPGGKLQYEDGSLTTGPLKIGSRSNIDRWVPAYSICETKYMFANYVKVGKTFGSGAAGYTSYMKGFVGADGKGGFKASCSADDLAWYYDFRGDSNFKPNTPESNAMIWMGKVAAAMCNGPKDSEQDGTLKARVTAKQGMSMTDQDCRDYYEKPFASRYGAARAGLASWIMHDSSLEKTYDDVPGKNGPGTFWTVVNHSYDNPNDVFSQKGPFLFRVKDKFAGGQSGKLQAPGSPGKFLPGFEQRMGDPDFGLAALSGKTGEAQKQFVFERIQRSVDRHTNWYASGYDRAPNLPLAHPARFTINQAYSPFVASSYEMNQSNGFVNCGVTIPCSGKEEFDGHKQWMFVFKVRKKNLMRPEDIAAGNVTPDFRTTWFDETAFGDDRLANSERALDRLGTVVEDEHSDILYLWNIPSGQ